MKFLALFVPLFSVSAWAGDGGFDLWPCVSNSGRTNLTIYSDNYSGAEVPMRVVFGIDGQFLDYDHYRYDINHSADKVCQDDCTQVQWNNDMITVRNGDFVNMEIELKGTQATVLKGFVDPRIAYQEAGVQVGAVKLTCKTFHQEP